MSKLNFTQAAVITCNAMAANENTLVKGASANEDQGKLIEQPLESARRSESNLEKLAAVLTASEVASELIPD